MRIAEIKKFAAALTSAVGVVNALPKSGIEVATKGSGLVTYRVSASVIPAPLAV